MPQTRIIKFQDNDELAVKLKACMEYNATHKPALSFSEFLAHQTTILSRLEGKSKKDIIIADISGCKINGASIGSLEGLDFGNVILSGTEFSQCNLRNARITSRTDMMAAKFLNNSDLSNASISGDISGLYIGGGTNVSNLDLTQATGLRNCGIENININQGSAVRVHFSSQEAFANYLNSKTQTPELVPLNDATTNTRAEAAQHISLAQALKRGTDGAYYLGAAGVGQITRGVEAGAHAVAAAAGQVANAAHANVIPTNIAGVTQTAAAVADAGRGFFSRMLGGAGKLAAAVGNIILPQVVDTSLAPQTTTSTGVAAADTPPPPSFKYEVKGKELSSTTPMTKEEVEIWAQNPQKISLAEYAKTLGKEPILSKLKLENIKFDNLDFSGAVISECNLTNCSFTKSNLSKATICDSKLSNCSFIECNAQGIDCSKTNFAKCNLQNSNFIQAKFTESHLEKQCTIDHCRMNGANFQSAYIPSLKITNSYLDNAKFNHAKGAEACFDHCTATYADFSSSILPGIRMKGLDLSNAMAHDAKFHNGIMDSVKLNNFQAVSLEMPRSNLTNISVEKADLSHANFSESKLDKISIKDSKMLKSSFEASSLDHVTLERCRAEGTNFSKAEMQGNSKIISCDLSYAKFTEANLTYVPNASDNGVSILNSNLTGANLANAKLTNTSIIDSNLSSSNLTNTQIKGGALDRTLLLSSDLSNAQIGTRAALTSVRDVVIDETSKLKDTQFGNPQDIIKMRGTNGLLANTSMGKAQTQVNAIQDINESGVPRQIIRGGVNRVVSWFKSFGEGAESVSNSVTGHTNSKLGTILGTVAGVVTGACVVAATAGSMGTALPIVGGIVVGSCGLAGAVTGHVGSSTTKGRRMFMIGATAAAATLLGPVGLVAAPAMYAYSALSGKKNAFSTSLGNLVGGIGAISKRIGSGLSGLTYSDAEVVAANNIKIAAKRTEDAVAKGQVSIDGKSPDNNAKDQNQALHYAQEPAIKSGKGKASQNIGILDSESYAKTQALDAPVPIAAPSPPVEAPKLGFLGWVKAKFSRAPTPQPVALPVETPARERTESVSSHKSWSSVDSFESAAAPLSASRHSSFSDNLHSLPNSTRASVSEGHIPQTLTRGDSVREDHFETAPTSQRPSRAVSIKSQDHFETPPSSRKNSVKDPSTDLAAAPDSTKAAKLSRSKTTHAKKDQESETRKSTQSFTSGLKREKSSIKDIIANGKTSFEDLAHDKSGPQTKRK